MAGDDTPLRSVEAIFHAVADLPIGERDAALDARCGTDTALRAEVADLLRVLDLSPDVAPETPERFGPYAVERELGRGGQGVVFLARDTRLDRRVALKVLTGFAARDEAMRARLQREAQVASRLEHPAICTVYEVGDADGAPFISMRYVDGEPLSHRVAATGAPPTPAAIRDTIALLEPIARGLQAAHDAGLVHRDVKPGNIMVTPEGAPVLLDFGIARETEGDHGLTESGQTIGTPAYMAPEQIAGDPVDGRTDVYALGVTLFECVTGRRPFDAPTRERLYAEILRSPSPHPRRCNAHVPPDVAAVLLVALEKSPDRRYASAGAFADDLRAILEYRPVAARPAGPLIRLGQFAKRNPVVATLIGVIVVLVGVGVAWLAIKNRELAESVKRERTAKIDARENLEAYERLADGERIRDYEADAGELPAWHREHADALAAWIARADALAARLPVHRARMRVLLDRAEPEDPAEHEAHPKSDDRLALRRRLARADAFLQRMEDAGWPEEHETRVARAKADRAKTAAELAAVEREIANDRRPRFASREDRWEHDTLRDIIARLERFAGSAVGDSALARVRQRLAFVRSLTESDKADRDAWRHAIASIANRDECAAYDGLAIEPITGLTPIRRDPQSGFWEFAHRQTGIPPAIGEDGRYRIDADTGLVFVLVPGGTFRMGATPPSDRTHRGPNLDPAARTNERPVHAVTLAPFLLSKYEMTEAQWLRFTGRNPSVAVQMLTDAERGCRPLQNVSWYDARDALAQLGMQLPTEAQWEYAYRAGSATIWPDGDDPARVRGAGNVRDRRAREIPRLQGDTEDFDDGHAFHAPVGRYRANRFGLHDMAGNVWEWCRDGTTEYGPEGPRSPDGLRIGTGSRSLAGLRGGSCIDLVVAMRSASRAMSDRGSHDNLLGIRPAIALDRAPGPK